MKAMLKVDICVGVVVVGISANGSILVILAVAAQKGSILVWSIGVIIEVVIVVGVELVSIVFVESKVKGRR